jgi:hypothetical protein
MVTPSSAKGRRRPLTCCRTGRDTGLRPAWQPTTGLRIAAILAEGIPVDLGEAVTGLDEVTIGLVAAAVVRANGRRTAAAGVSGVQGR